MSTGTMIISGGPRTGSVLVITLGVMFALPEIELIERKKGFGGPVA